jgi:exopolysaccharide biosynthesis polyprenyl glycosylphosphotransferase
MESHAANMPAVDGATHQGALEAAGIAHAAPAQLRTAHPSRRASRVAEWDLLVDASMLALAALGLLAGDAIPALSVDISPWSIAFPVVALISLALFGLYRVRLGARYLDDLPRILAATAVAAMAVTFVQVLVVEAPDAAPEMLRAWVLATGLLLAGRGGMALAERRARTHGTGGSPTLIIGAGRVGRLIAKRLIDKPAVGLRPLAFVDDDPLPEADLDPEEVQQQSELPIFDTGPELGTVVRELGIDHAILGFSSSSHETQLDLARRLTDLGVTVSVVPRLFEAMPDRVVPQRTVGLPLFSIFPSTPRGWRMSVKYALDRMLALLALLVLSPLLIVSAIATLVSVGRPIFYRQERIGLGGREFEMLKFRTMRAPKPADDSGGEVIGAAFQSGLAPGGVEGDDRRTRVGSLLRRTGLDELPQLFNVARGEMSIVGPRPEREELVPWFEREVYRYRERHRMKPGITGWAQVHGLRGKTSLADRVEWDNYYIENWSPWLDFKILVLTLAAPFQPDIE